MPPEYLERYPTSVGKPAMGTMVKIFDDDGNELPSGETGYIYTGCSLTLSKFISDRDQLILNKGLLRSGDLGYLNEEGYLFVKGRSDSAVIRSGENCYPLEAEDVINALPGVADAFVLSRQNGQIMAELIAYIMREDSPSGAALTDDSIKQWVGDHLASFNIPDMVMWIDSLPRNENGKVVSRYLPEPGGAPNTTEEEERNG